jgi:hypothetical protein
MTSPEVTSTTEKNSPPSTQSEPGALSFADYEKFRRGDLKLDGDATKSAPESKPTQEQKVAANSESAESEEDEIDESDESDKDADDSDKSKPKKKSGYQRRIDKLNARHKAAQDELEYWKSQALKTGQAEPKQEQKVDRKADGKPNPESFETHSEYVEALTDWKLDQKEASRRAEEEKSKVLSEQEKLYKAHLEREKSFIDKTDDYADVLEDVNYLQDATPALQQLIVSSDNGPEIMYELAKNKAEYERINKLPPLALARELGRLESKIISKASDDKKPEPKKLTSAPKPIDPVSKGKGTVAKSIDDPSLSFTDYVRLRREQMKRRG